MRNIFVLFVLFSTVEGSPNTFQAILDRARQRTLSGTALKKSRSCTADHDALIRDLVTSHSENESLSNLYKVFEKLLAHLGMDAMSEGSFNHRAGEVRCQLRRLPSNTVTTLGASKPSSEDPEFCITVNDQKCSARELDKRRRFDTDSNFARSMLDNDDSDMGELGQETIEALENQDMLISSSEDLAMAKKDDSTLLNANLDTKYTLAHDQLIMDVVNSFKSAGLSRQYEIFNQLTADLGMVEMERNTFVGRASHARKQAGDPAKRNRREPGIGFEPSRILDFFFQENPTISINGAGDSPKASEHEVSHRVQDLRASRQIDMEEGIAQVSNDPVTETRQEEAIKSSSRKNSSRRIKTFTAQHDDLIMQVVKRTREGETVARQYELFKRLSHDAGLEEMSRSLFGWRVTAARRQLWGAPGEPSARIPAVGVANSEILNNLFEMNPKISPAAAFKALESLPRGTHDSALPSMALVRNWVHYRRSMQRFVKPKNIPGESSSSVREPQDDDEDCFREILSALAADRGEAVSCSKDHQEDDADDWREIAFMLSEKQEDDMAGPSSSGLSLVEEEKDDVDIWKEISCFLTEVSDEDNDKSVSAQQGPGANQVSGKRKRKH